MTAGGQGLNLQAATTILFAELPSKATLLHQCEARAHRQGQNSTVLVYLAIADDASDRATWTQLQRSDVRVGRILDGHRHAPQSTMAVNSIAPATALAEPHGDSTCVAAGDGETEIKIEPDEDFEMDDHGRHSVDSGGRRSDGAGANPARDVCVEEDLPAGAALFFLGVSTHGKSSLLWMSHSLLSFGLHCFVAVSAHTGWVHLVQPDGTRLVRLDGTPLCFPWVVLNNDTRPPRWLARGTALRGRVEDLYAEWKELGPIQQRRLVGRPMATPLKEFMAPLPGSKKTQSSTVRVSDRREMLTSKQPQGGELKEQVYETHLGSSESWPQYISKFTKRPYCSWLGCRREYDRTGLLKAGLLPFRGKRQFFCSDECSKSYSLRTDGSALRREAWDRDHGKNSGLTVNHESVAVYCRKSSQNPARCLDPTFNMRMH